MGTWSSRIQDSGQGDPNSNLEILTKMNQGHKQEGNPRGGGQGETKLVRLRCTGGRDQDPAPCRSGFG